MKLVLCICITVPLILWPAIGIIGSVIGGAAYGLLSPIFATFDAVGEGKTNEFFHCIYVSKFLSLDYVLFYVCCFFVILWLISQDGTWDTVTGCFTIVRDFGDVCYHSYFSIMDDLLQCQGPQEGKYYEIRLCFIYFFWQILNQICISQCFKLVLKEKERKKRKEIVGIVI